MYYTVKSDFCTGQNRNGNNSKLQLFIENQLRNVVLTTGCQQCHVFGFKLHIKSGVK